MDCFEVGFGDMEVLAIDGFAFGLKPGNDFGIFLFVHDIVFFFFFCLDTKEAKGQAVFSFFLNPTQCFSPRPPSRSSCLLDYEGRSQFPALKSLLAFYGKMKKGEVSCSNPYSSCGLSFIRGCSVICNKIKHLTQSATDTVTVMVFYFGGREVGGDVGLKFLGGEKVVAT